MSTSRKIVSLCIALALIIWAGYYLYIHPPKLPELRELSLISILSIAISGQFFLFCQGLLIRQTLLPFGIKLSFKEWYGILNVTLLGNYIVPFTGLGVRAHYLNQVYRLPYKSFAATLLLMYPVQIVVFSFWGAIALAIAFFMQGYFDALLTLVLLSITLSPIVLLLMASRIHALTRHEKIKIVIQNFRDLLTKPSYALSLFAQASFMYIGAFSFFVFSFQALKYTIPLSGAAIAASVANVASFIKIAPAAIGSYDAALIYVASAFNIGVAEGVVVATLTRVFLMAWFIILGPIYSYILFKDIGEQKNAASIEPHDPEQLSHDKSATQSEGAH